MAKIDTLCKTKTTENRTLWGRAYLDSPYKGVAPGRFAQTRTCSSDCLKHVVLPPSHTLV